MSATTVLVVGGGPVGLTMAAELTRYGVKTRVVEKAAARTDKSKALVVWSRTLELLDRWECAGGERCGAAFVAAGMRVEAANFRADGKMLGRVTFEGVESPYPFALMIPQSETERLLEEHLESLGVRVERQVELTGFTQDANGVRATLRGVDGREETVETGWMVACDGAHSTIRHGLGMEFEGETLKSDWVLADVKVEGLEPADELSLNFSKHGILVLFPFGQNDGHGGRCRVIANVVKEAEDQGDPTLEEVQRLLGERGRGELRVSDPVWLANFHINERKVKEYRQGRVLLAGDASHIHSPAGGQGMNTGMQDAFNLGWKLAMVVQGAADTEALLGTYTPERSAVGAMVLKNANRLTEVGILQGDWQQALRNAAVHVLTGFETVQHTMAEMLTEVEVGYAKSELNVSKLHLHAGPKAGDRAPMRKGEVSVGTGNTPLFTLFGEGGVGWERLVAEYPRLLAAEVRTGFAEGGLWVVRPDGYVAVAARAGEWEAVEELCQRIAARA